MKPLSQNFNSVPIAFAVTPLPINAFTASVENAALEASLAVGTRRNALKHGKAPLFIYQFLKCDLIWNLIYLHYSVLLHVYNNEIETRRF